MGDHYCCPTCHQHYQHCSCPPAPFGSNNVRMAPPPKPPRVFAPMVPSRFDHTLKQFIPTVNMDPAKQFGELVVMLPPDAGRIQTVPLIAALKERMDDFGPEDYVVALGDPALIAAACIIAHRKTGRLRMLKWDRHLSTYQPMEIKL